MLEIALVFASGAKVKFSAQEFDIGNRTDQHMLSRFEYKDFEGNVRPLYLTLGEVAGVVITPFDQRGESALHFEKTLTDA